MNERIKELAEQAAHDTRKEHNNAYWRMQDEIAEDSTWREKFAELIVRECCNIMNQEALLTDHVSAEMNQYASKRLLTTFENIEKHFGIKE